VREIRTHGSEGGAGQANAPFLPLSFDHNFDMALEVQMRQLFETHFFDRMIALIYSLNSRSCDILTLR
jgi:hypothetical protein